MMMQSHIRTATFGRGAVIMRARGNEPIGLDEIAARAPSVFAEDRHESRSERYTYIPTRDLLAGMAREGFQPFEVRQGGSKDENKRAHTKHMIRLRHAGTEGFAVAKVDQVVPEIILLNSHDGTSSYQLTAGCFRMVCTNGLIAGDAFEHVRIPHKGDVIHEVIEGAFKVINEFPAMIDATEEMAATTLSEGEQLAYARAVRALRWEPDEHGNSTAPIEADTLLRARRGADAGADMWRTFNRVQENVVRGGQHYFLRDPVTNRIRQNRQVAPVRGMDQDRALNRAMWTLAQELQRLREAA